jgi:hypothetical protein
LKEKGGWSAFFSFKIADCVRTGSSSVRNRRSARTGRRPRKLWRYSSTYPAMRANVAGRKLRALRANRVFGADEKRIRTKYTVMDKNRAVLE